MGRSRPTSTERARLEEQRLLEAARSYSELARMLRSLRELAESVAAGRAPAPDPTGAPELQDALWPVACRPAERLPVARWLAGDEGALDALPPARRALLELARLLNRAVPAASLAAHWDLVRVHARTADEAPEDPDHSRLLEKLRLVLTALGHRGPGPVPPLYRAHPGGWHPPPPLGPPRTLEEAAIRVAQTRTMACWPTKAGSRA